MTSKKIRKTGRLRIRAKTSLDDAQSRSGRWLMVAYDLPTEPSKFRVKVWRDLKSQGGLYPEMSFCILPNTEKVLRKLDEVRSEISKVGNVLVLQTEGFTRQDNKSLLSMIRDQTERQYAEILEECQEFLDEIKSNIAQGVFKDEEIQELDKSLESLNRWFEETHSLDAQKLPSKTRLRVKQLLEKCQRELDDYAAMVEKRSKKNRPKSLR
ncbi:MAG: hypothetical protein JRN20_07420 [Nitrososphaerota archaeon]|nr:hypothetical protein [Nitrososphaerota archaeon]